MEWIKSSSQLPKVKQLVWVFNGMHCHATIFDPANAFFDLWVPLPEPPTADTAEGVQTQPLTTACSEVSGLSHGAQICRYLIGKCKKFGHECTGFNGMCKDRE